MGPVSIRKWKIKTFGKEFKKLGKVLGLKLAAFTGFGMSYLTAGFKDHQAVYRKTMQTSRSWFAKTTFRKGYLKSKRLKAAQAMKRWRANQRKQEQDS
jgi:hypothetical protein